MNKDVRLVELENYRVILLQSNNLHKDATDTFRASIKQVSVEESESLGKELFEHVSAKQFKDDTDKVIELIQKGANIGYQNEKGDFPLLVCARKGHLNTFIVLIKAGANVNQTNNYLTTTTMAAARHGQKEMLRILIQFGADINARCLDGDTAIMSAKRHSKQECFDILKNAQASLRNKNLANQTLDDIEGDVGFTLSMLDSPDAIKRVTEEDAKELIEEAKQKIKTLK